jgi:phosphoenolpyruvate carboxylase
MNIKEMAERFYKLDAAVAGLKGLMVMETDAALAPLRVKLEALQESERQARDAVLEVKAAMESIITGHETHAKRQGMISQRREVAAELVVLTGMENWWKHPTLLGG